MANSESKKDVWDRLTALATILVPAAIALAGHFIAQGLKQAEISSEEKRAEQSHLIAEANTKIAQATLINTMMKSLTSPNPQERKLAVQAVLIALPEQGPVLVRTIAQSDEDTSVQAAAQSSLQERVGTLVRGLFSEDARVRIGAAQDLIVGWRNDPNVVQELVQFASNNRDNVNGVYNTVVVLNEFTSRALEEHREQVLSFLELAMATGAKTKSKAEALAKRIRG